MLTKYTLKVPRNAFSGENARENIPGILKEAGAKRVAVFTSKGLEETGLVTMIMGMGNYKLTEFWKFSIPMYFIRIIFLSLGAVLIFPL